MNLCRRRGFSQLEVVISTILVGVLMVSSFSAVAASRRSQTFESNKVRGLAIAEALLTEISQLPLREPSCDCGFGKETGESGTNRSAYDDIDDYDKLMDSPPKSKNGTPCIGYTDLSRRVAVENITPSDWSVSTSTYTGVYRITVTVLRGTLEVCRVVGYRADGYSSSSLVLSASTIQ
jgi:type II secretory pathway pseudopilin PulG